MTLSGLRANIYRSPLFVGATCAKIQKLNFEKAFYVIFSIFSEVIAIVGCKFIMSVLAGDNVFQYNISFGIFMTEHQCTSQISRSCATCSTPFGPFATFIARWQYLHRFCEISFYLVKHLVLRIVGCIHGVDVRIRSIVGNQRNSLVIGSQIIIGQRPEEESLSGDLIIGSFRHFYNIYF